MREHRWHVVMFVVALGVLAVAWHYCAHEPAGVFDTGD
jgi:hypothetical protein